MQEGSREVLQRLIYHTHPDDFETFLKYFDEKERVALSHLPKHAEPIALHLDSASEMLHKFHYSWFIEPLEKHPKKLRKEILQVFNSHQKERLSKHLGIKESKNTLAEPLHKYFIHWFLKEIGYHLLPPSCFFSQSMCIKLVSKTKEELVSTLHHLGIIDIANMAKRIVDQRTLKELLAFLNPAQKKLYSEAQKKFNEPLASTTQDLKKKLEGDRSFTNFLEKRGILRLSKALASENSFFIWHLAHILDKGRGQEFLSVARKCISNPHTSYYMKQLLQISNLIEDKK